MRLRVLLASSSLIAIAHSTPASAATSNVVTTEHVAAQLIAERTAVVPDQSVSIALRLTHIPHWHSYWRNPDDSGLPTTIRWTLPEGVLAGAIQWPTPQRLPFGPLTNLGYEGEVWLVSDIALPETYSATAIIIEAPADWLVCSDICIPETGTFTLTLPVRTDANPSVNEEARAGFAHARANHPRRNPAWTASATLIDRGIAVHFAPSSGLREAYFFPYQEGQVEPSGVQVLRSAESRNVLARVCRCISNGSIPPARSFAIITAVATCRRCRSHIQARASSGCR